MTTSSVDESKFHAVLHQGDKHLGSVWKHQTPRLRRWRAGVKGQERQLGQIRDGAAVFCWLRWVACWKHRFTKSWTNGHLRYFLHANVFFPVLTMKGTTSFSLTASCWRKMIKATSSSPQHKLISSTASQLEWSPNHELKMYQLNVDTTNDALEEVYPA